MATLICDAPPATRMYVTRELATTAWLASDHNVSPGWLIYQDGMLMYCDHSGQVVFETLASDIERVDFPWWRLGRVCRIRVFGETFRFRFDPPQGGWPAVRVQGMNSPEITPLVAKSKPSGAEVAKAWRAVLA